MIDTELGDFIDGAYEASVVPELWPKVLRDFARLADSKMAALVTTNAARNGEDFKFIGSSPAAVEFATRTHSYPSATERSRILLAQNHPGFLVDIEFFTPEEIAANPLYTEFLIPSGYGRGIATAVISPSGDDIIFHAEGGHAQGPVEPAAIARLDSLRPHLARAALLSARLGLQQAQAATAALELVGLPAAVLGQRGQAIAANELLTAMMPHVLQDLPSRLALTNPRADALLKAALEAVGQISGDERTRSIPISAGEGHPPVIVHVVPIRGAARDIFVGAACVLVATPVVPRQVPGANVLQGLFDLTPAEAKVAEAIGRGEVPADIAAAGRLSVLTVRNQVAAVLAKTGLSRQADLVGLLAGQRLE